MNLKHGKSGSVSSVRYTMSDVTDTQSDVIGTQSDVTEASDRSVTLYIYHNIDQLYSSCILVYLPSTKTARDKETKN